MAVFDKKPQGTLREVINQLVESSNDDSKRLRALEQRDEVVNSRLNSLEQTLEENHRALKKSLKAVEERLSDADDRFHELESKIEEMVRHLKRGATKSELKALEHLIDMYNPVKSEFATREEVRDLLKKR